MRIHSTNFAIGVLSTTAVILLVGLILVQTRPQVLRADGMTTYAGEYVLTVGSLSNVDEELVYVINVPEEKLVTYRFDSHRRQIEVVQGIDLAPLRRDPAVTDPAAKSKPARPRQP